MPIGHYTRKPRATRRVIFVCNQCGIQRGLKPGEYRQRTGRYCSAPCQRASRQRVTSVWLYCKCGTLFLKARRFIKAINYCSKACSGEARKTPGSIWSETGPKSEAAKQYFREYHKANKKAHVARARDWSVRNPVKRKSIRQAWAKTHRLEIAAIEARRRTATRAEEAATAQDWLDVLAAHGGQCAHCGTVERIECDHIIPIAKGGLHVKENLQPLCRSCNARKGVKTPAYRIKKKLVKALHGIEILET